MDIIVNGEKTSADVIAREIENLKQQHPDWPESQILEHTRENIIEWAIIRQEAARRITGISMDDVEAGFKKLTDGHGGKAEFFRRFHLTASQKPAIKKDIEQNLKTTRFLNDLVKDVPAPSAEAVRSFYDEHRSEFMEPEKVHAAHIVKQPAHAEASEQAEQELLATRNKLLAGANFLEMAGAVSDCRDSSPDLGFFPRGRMAPEFEVVVFSMKVGEISPIFQTSFGLHIATVLAREASRQSTLDECREQIAEMLHHDLKNDVIGQWVDEQKKTASVTVTT